MDSKKRTKITIKADDENSLYSSFSPEPEFSYEVQFYIKTKAEGEDTGNIIDLHVVSQEPVDEDRFRTAASNFFRQEKAMLRIKEKETMRMLIGSLVIGSVLIVLSIVLEQRFEVVTYSLLPIMASLALGNAAGILLVDMPTVRAEKWMLNEMEKNSRIIFEYGSDKEMV